MDPLSLRVDRLETEVDNLRHQNRLLRRVLLFSVLVGFLVFHAFAEDEKVPKQVKAEKFVVVNSAGSPRAVLATRTDGKTGLEIRDGNRRILLRLPQAEK